MGTLFVTAQVQKLIAVAHNTFPLLLKQSLQLRKVLNDDGNGNLTASHGGQELIKLIRQSDIGKLVHDKMHMHGQSAAVNGVGLIVELLKQLGIKHTHDEIEGAIVIGNHGEYRRFLFADLPQIHFIALGNAGQRIQIELFQTGDKGNLDGFQRLSAAGVIRPVILEGDMLRVPFLQSFKQLIENRLILLVVLLYIAGSDHLHDHRKVLLVGRSLIMEIADKGLEQHRCRLIPERVLCLRTFGRCVLKEVCGKPLNIIIAADIHERVVAMAFLHINEVKDFYFIALLLQQMAGIPEQFTLGVKHNERSIRIHNVGLGVEACFTCTGTAAYKYIQISAVLSSVQADGDILRQQLVFRLILVGIFLVDRTSRAPFS